MERSPLIPAQPVLIPSVAAFNGRPAVHFYASSNQFFNLPKFLSGTNQAEAFVVLRAATNRPAGSRSLWQLGSANLGRYPQTDGTISDDFGSSAVKNMGVPAQSLTEGHLYNVTSRTGEWIARINGTIQYATTNNTAGWFSTFYLGRGYYGFFDGDIAEVLIFNRVLSGSERDAVAEYLTQKYGLAGFPPAAPVDLNAWALSPSQMSLNWSNSLGNAKTTFKVERSVDGVTFSQVALLDNSSSWVDSGLAAGTKYYYRVKASNYAGDSDYSNLTNATTLQSGVALPISDLQLWLKGDSGHGSGPINFWMDQSDKGNHATQSGNNRPVAVEGAFNGKSAVHFYSSSNQYLNLPKFLSGTNEAEAFVVLRAATNRPASSRSLWQLGSANLGRYPQTDGTISDDFGSSAVKNMGVPAQSLTEGHLYNVTSRTGEWIARINGTIQYATTNNTAGWFSTFYLGRGYYGFFDGDIAEVLIFNRVLSGSERDTLGLFSSEIRVCWLPTCGPNGY